MTKRRWKPASAVNLDPRNYWQRLWDKWSLCLVFPRQIPEWVDDWIIEQKLAELEATEVAPWEHCPDEEFLLAGEER